MHEETGENCSDRLLITHGRGNTRLITELLLQESCAIPVFKESYEMV